MAFALLGGIPVALVSGVLRARRGARSSIEASMERIEEAAASDAPLG